jgi:large subunit ribosomal protein L18
MGMFTNQSVKARKLRQARVRKRIRGTASCPRLSVFRSEKHIYVQVISDETGETLLTTSTLTPEVRGNVQKTANVEAAKKVGEAVGKACLEKGITAAIFDRNGFLYHGRVRAVAEGAREAGLKI